MADAPAGPLTGVGEHRVELRKEALTMALYVAICLLASLIVIPESTAEHSNLIGLTWGITVGLALAHWFAFRVSARRRVAARSAPRTSRSSAPSCSARPASQWWSPWECCSCPTPSSSTAPSSSSPP